MGFEEYLTQEFEGKDVPVLPLKILQLMLKEIPYQQVVEECDLLIIHHCEEVRIGEFRCFIFFDKTTHDCCLVNKYMYHAELSGKKCIVFSQSLRVPQRVTPVSCKKRMKEDEKIVKNCIRSLLFYELITFWIKQWVGEKIQYFYKKRGGLFGKSSTEEVVMKYTAILARFYETWYAIHVFDVQQVKWYLENSYELRRRDTLV